MVHFEIRQTRVKNEQKKGHKEGFKGAKPNEGAKRELRGRISKRGLFGNSAPWREFERCTPSILLVSIWK